MLPLTLPLDIPSHGTANERYAQCRAMLVDEQEKPVKDPARIDALIGELDTLQRHIKRQHENHIEPFED